MILVTGQVTQNQAGAKGFTLVEIMVSIALGLLLMLAIVAIYAGIRAGQQLQNGLTHVQENGRVAIHIIAKEVRNAGFRKPVWNEPDAGYFPITDGSLEGLTGANDTLQLMYQDDSNCRGVANVNIDPETGEPVMGYKQVTFSVDDDEVLLWTCEYGLTPAAMVEEYANQGIIDGVESFQVLFGVDTDFPPDFSVNSWTTASAIEPRSTVCVQSQSLCESQGLLDNMAAGVPVAVKIGLLIASPRNADMSTDTQAFEVLDVHVAASNDNKIRKAFATTVNMRNLTL